MSKIQLNESLFEAVNSIGRVRPDTYKKRQKPISVLVFDSLETLGYNVYASSKGNGYEISKKYEKNLQKAKDLCDALNLDYTVRPFRDRFYMTINLPKEDENTINKYFKSTDRVMAEKVTTKKGSNKLNKYLKEDDNTLSIEDKFNYLKSYPTYDSNSGEAYTRPCKVWDLGLTDEQTNEFFKFLEDGGLEAFWNAHEYDSLNIYQEGRMGGHLILDPQIVDPYVFDEFDSYEEYLQNYLDSNYYPDLETAEGDLEYSSEQIENATNEVNSEISGAYDALFDFDNRVDALIRDLKGTLDLRINDPDVDNLDGSLEYEEVYVGDLNKGDFIKIEDELYQVKLVNIESLTDKDKIEVKVISIDDPEDADTFTYFDPGMLDTTVYRIKQHKSLKETFNRSIDEVKNILQPLVTKDGKVRALKDDEKLPRGFNFKSGNGTSGEVNYRGTDYTYAIVNGKLKVMTSAEAGDNWSETIYKEDLDHEYKVFTIKLKDENGNIYTEEEKIPAYVLSANPDLDVKEYLKDYYYDEILEVTPSGYVKTESLDNIQTTIDKIFSSGDEGYPYAMLDRMKSDCEYYLGYGNRSSKYLWGEEPKQHIETMKAIYNRLDPKPEWLTIDKINEYEKNMLEEPLEYDSTVKNESFEDDDIEKCKFEIRIIPNKNKDLDVFNKLTHHMDYLVDIDESNYTFWNVNVDITENLIKVTGIIEGHECQYLEDYIDIEAWPEINSIEVDVYKENIKESFEDEHLGEVSKKEFTVTTVDKNGSTYLGRVKAKDNKEAENKFLTYKDNKDLQIAGSHETTPDEIRKGVRLIEDMEMVPETPTVGPELGIAGVINSLIIDEFEAIDGYNSAIATAEEEGMTDIVNVLKDIANEENLHVGQLQTCLAKVSPNAQSIDNGQIEAQQQLDDVNQTQENKI